MKREEVFLTSKLKHNRTYESAMKDLKTSLNGRESSTLISTSCTLPSVGQLCERRYGAHLWKRRKRGWSGPSE